MASSAPEKQRMSNNASNRARADTRSKTKVRTNTIDDEPHMSQQAPFIIGVTGGTASGKTSVCLEIEKRLSSSRVAIISQDSFYKSLTPEQREKVEGYNFDHPDAFDFGELSKCLRDLVSGGIAQIPNYDFKTHSRTSETTTVSAVDVLLFEGILAFYDQDVRDVMNMKLFVDTDADVRLCRRILRDIRERGRGVESVLFQYEKFVKPAFDNYILPTKKFADVIIPRGSENDVAIDLIVQHIRVTLEARRRGGSTQFDIDL